MLGKKFKITTINKGLKQMIKLEKKLYNSGRRNKSKFISSLVI